ncbi:hypothetical protein BpHYR1_027178 [Brachionus plicatilis]|uniref:Uncharacterized protein n=1 Tax=Brachionus plicatilis TaxID=10195 RepID=A0A3M7QPF5_BRAPC|nr:hypothetical protein BpHYR1_027178 [Brachionus plicatilis]
MQDTSTSVSTPVVYNKNGSVYVRPCTKYPTHDIKACVAKQGDTNMLDHWQRAVFKAIHLPKSHDAYRHKLIFQLALSSMGACFYAAILIKSDH